jgi:chemotaxis response regulator CheB
VEKSVLIAKPMEKGRNEIAGMFDNGWEVIKKADNRKPIFIAIDLKMPRMDGLKNQKTSKS